MTLSASLSVPLTGLHTSLSVALIGLSTPAETSDAASAGAEPLVRRLSGHAERVADIGPGGAKQASTCDVDRSLNAEPLSGAQRLPGSSERLDALEVGWGHGHGGTSRADRFFGRSRQRRAPRRCQGFCGIASRFAISKRL
jgi:hypothetical protein